MPSTTHQCHHQQDPNYYVEVAGGSIYPTKTWCFFAEIVDDSLAQVMIEGRG